MLNAPSRAGSLRLVGGVLALDFANTASGRGTPDHVEHLQTEQNLREWGLQAGLLQAGSSQAIGVRESGGRSETPAPTQAIELRDAIYQLGAALAHGTAPEAADLARLRDATRDALGRSRFTRADRGYTLDFSHGTLLDAVLGSVAWSALDLLREGQFNRVKQCPGRDCGWLFFDRSKNNTRIWCDMAVCGNRTKARRHRSRSTVSVELPS